MRILLLLFIACSTIVQSQTLFTDQMVGDFPASLLSLDGYLYVGTLESGGPQNISRIQFEDPDSVELVSDFGSAPGFGVWKMAFDAQENRIYAWDVFTYGVDLDNAIPIEKELVSDLPTSCSNGIAYFDGYLYYGCTSTSIDRIDPTAMNPVPETVIDLTDLGEPFNPAFYQGELYFSLRLDGDYDLYKLDPSNPESSLTLVSNLEENSGGVQSSLVADDFLYLGIEGSPHRVLKLDLSNTNYPIEEEILFDNFSGGPIGLARQGNIIYISDSNTQNIFQFTDEELSTKQSEFSKPEVYPIPATDELFVSGLDSDTPFVIYNALGAQISTGTTVNGMVNVESLNPGVYFIQLDTLAGSNSLKFLKK